MGSANHTRTSHFAGEDVSCVRSTPSAARAVSDGEVLARWTMNDRDLRVRALRPHSHPELADAFEAAHRAALRRHGVEPTSIHPCRGREKVPFGQTWLLVVELDGAGIHAGIRIDTRSPAQPLQSERVLARFGIEQLARLRGRFLGTVGEFTGLWVLDESRKCGLPPALVRAGIAMAQRIGLTRLFALPPAHTRGLFEAESFRIVRELGDEGAFWYPDERYRSWVVELDLPHGRCPREGGR